MLAIVLLWFLFSKISWESVYAQATAVTTGDVIIILILLLIQPIFLALRWRLVIPLYGAEVPFLLLLRYTYESLFFNQTMPSSVGGDVVKIWRSYKYGLDLSQSTNSVIYDRAIGLITLIVIGMIGLPFIFPLIPEWHVRFALLSFVSLPIIFFVFLSLAHQVPQSIRKFKIVALAIHLSTGAQNMFKSWKSSMLPIFLLSFVIHLISITVILLLAKSIYGDADLTAILKFIPWVFIAMAIPISIAGWGVRESVMVVTFGLAGIPADAALATSICYGLLLVLVGLCGGLVWMMSADHAPVLPTQ